MSSLIVFSIEQYSTFTLTNKKVGLWDLWGRWERREGGGASAAVAPPPPKSLAFVNYFFTLEEFILVVASWVIMTRLRDIGRFL